MERHIQYLRELAVSVVIYNDPNNEQLPTDADEFQFTQPMLWKFLWSAVLPYANSLVVKSWKEDKGQTVDEMSGQLW